MKASIYIAMTLDGYIARENGDLDWLLGSNKKAENVPENEDIDFNAFMASVDVLVLGRNTYEFVVSYGEWPYGNMSVIVLSSTLTVISDDFSNKIQLRNCSPVELYDELKDSGKKHLYIDGGKTIQGFLKAGLINEIIITKIPILIGSGIPLFGQLSKDVKLRHLETVSFKNGFVRSKYEVLT